MALTGVEPPDVDVYFPVAEGPARQVLNCASADPGAFHAARRIDSDS